MVSREAETESVEEEGEGGEGGEEGEEEAATKRKWDSSSANH
jgi:hypothetical protein